MLFRRVLLSNVANPLVVLHKLEKASGRSAGYRPANALDALPEPVMARHFRDKSADIEFDASHVWRPTITLSAALTHQFCYRW